MRGIFYSTGSLLLRLDFVAAQVFLGFNKQHVLAKLFAVLLQLQLLGSVHRVLARVVNTLARLLAHQANQFALIVFLSHNSSINLLCQQSY